MTNSEILLRDVLCARGLQLFNLPPSQVHQFADDARADVLVKDLKHYPHAFVLACIMDQQYPSERVWGIPYRLQQKLNGDFTMARLKVLSPADIVALMTQPRPLHRFAARMAGYVYDAIQRISGQYRDDASQIWAGLPDCRTVLDRFREFRGVGPKIAHMAVNCLVREMKVPLRDYSDIDISSDVHVVRVFCRAGLTAEEATEEATKNAIIEKARLLNPDFPGLLDFAAWEVGRNWCHPTQPECSACYLKRDCATARQAQPSA